MHLELNLAFLEAQFSIMSWTTMKKIQNIISKIDGVTFPFWTPPLLLLLVCFFSFGVLLSRLGFFQDDWHHVFYAYWQGAQGLQRFLFADSRPFAYLVYTFFFNLLGYSPAYWHWSLMVIRFSTAIMFWFCLRQLWPRQNALAAWLALMFAIYPIFTLQPLSVAYTLHWVMYLVFMLSLFFMLFAMKHQKVFLPLTSLALILEATHLIFIEYFSGLELSRLIFVWLFFSDLPHHERLKRTLRYSLPYLGILFIYVVYRSSFSIVFGYDRFSTLATLGTLVHTPIASLTGLFQSMLQDLVYIVFSPWYAAIDPAIIDLTRPSTYLIFGSIFLFAIAAWFLISRLKEDEKAAALSGLGKQVALGGLLSLILSLLPSWLVGLSIFQKNLLWSERLALSAMVGAGMLVTGMVYMLIDKPFYRHIVLGILLGLGIGLQVQTARSYQASWDKQEEFYWQLYWRAPALQPNTLLVSDQEILFYMGYYPTAFAINLLYPQVSDPPVASYWFNAGTEHINWNTFAGGQSVELDKYVTTFSANVHDVVAFTFEPGLDQCLWILRPQYQDVRGLTPEAYTWMKVSNISRIQPVSKAIPPEAIFGNEPYHDWCFYYEKADLASQDQEWGKIIQLWQEAGHKGVRAHNSIELLPFIEAYAEEGNWTLAGSITIQAEVLPDRNSSELCDVWRGLGSTTPQSPERDQTAALIEARLGCQE